MTREAPRPIARPPSLASSSSRDLFRSLTPEELVQRCIERGAGAWEEFLRRYADLIFSTILRVDVDPPDREDVFQSTVLAICSSIDRLRKPESLVPWIIGIAYRQSVQRIRLQMHGRTVPLSAPRPEGAEAAHDAADATEPPDSLRIRLEESQRVREAMWLLPERCRRLIALLFFEDPALGYDEIARREAIPIGSIGPTRARCLDRLRRRMVEGGWDP